MRITKVIKYVISLFSFFAVAACSSLNNSAHYNTVKRTSSKPTVSFSAVTFNTNKTWCLIQFSAPIHNSTTTEYLQNTIGDNITLNGESCATSFTYVGPWANNFFDCVYVQFMESKVVSTDTYLNPTVHIKSGTHFYDAVLPDVTIEYIDGAWVASSNVTYYTGFNTWNNEELGGYSQSLMGFNANLFTSGAEAADYKENIGSQITLNGESVATAAHKIGSWGGTNFLNCLYIVFPLSKISGPTNKLVINSGTVINGKTLKAASFTLVDGKWQLDTIDYSTVSYLKMGGWNNYSASNQTHNLIKFNTKLHSQPSYVNLASGLGNGVTLNGVPLSQIGGYFGSYPGGNYDCVYFYFNSSYLTTDGVYAYPTLHVEEGTPFFDEVLPEITLHLYKDKWVQYDTPTAHFNKVNLYHNNGAGVADYASVSNATCTIIEFNADLGGDDMKTNFILNGDDIGNAITVNGVSMTTMYASYANATGIWYHPGFSFKYGITLHIPTNYLTTNSEYEYPTLEIKDGTLFMSAHLAHTILYLVDNAWTATSPYGEIHTASYATLRDTNGNVNGMSFETRVDYDTYNTIKATYSNIEMGTLIIDQASYASSGYNNIADYIAHISPSSTTYADIKNDYNDFTNKNTAPSQGYYLFKGSLINIKNTNICRYFIPVGYIKYNGVYHFGQSGKYATSLYDVLKEAYTSGETRAANYLKYVAEFTYTPSTGVLTNVSTVDNNHAISRSNHDSHSITAAINPIYGIVVNGKVKRTNIAVGNTKYINYNHDVLTIDSTINGINYGVCGPNNELWADNNSNTTYNSMNVVTSLSGAFNSKCARIWLQNNRMISTPGWEDSGFIYPGPDIVLDPTELSTLKQTIQAYRENGVQEIILLCASYARTFDDHIYWSASNNRVYSVNEYNALPDESKPTDIITYTTSIPTYGTAEFTSFLANQQEYYRLLAAELADDIDAIEFLNEVNLGGSAEHYLDTLTGGPELPVDTFANIIADFQKAVYTGVHSSTDRIRVLTPALSCIGNISANPTYKRDARDYLPAMYSAIAAKGDNPDEYFDAVNVHPYIYNSKGIAAYNCDLYLYTNTPSGKIGNINNTDYADDWAAYMNALYNICVNNGDSEKQFYITEFGATDYGIGTTNVTTDGNWKNFNKNNILNEVILNTAAKMESLPYLRTVCFFRFLDFNPPDGNRSMAACTECNFGVINEDLTLKQTGKAIYQAMNNGSTDYSAIENYLATLRGS